MYWVPFIHREAHREIHAARSLTGILRFSVKNEMKFVVEIPHVYHAGRSFYRYTQPNAQTTSFKERVHNNQFHPRNLKAHYQ